MLSKGDVKLTCTRYFHLLDKVMLSNDVNNWRPKVLIITDEYVTFFSSDYFYGQIIHM